MKDGVAAAISVAGGHIEIVADHRGLPIPCLHHIHHGTRLLPQQQRVQGLAAGIQIDQEHPAIRRFRERGGQGTRNGRGPCPITAGGDANELGLAQVAFKMHERAIPQRFNMTAQRMPR